MRLKIDDLSMTFSNSKEAVLSNINYDDEFNSLAIIGSSGGGKSTLLRLIGGLIKADKGTICIDGNYIPNSEKALIFYRRNLGYVFQQGGLFKNMTLLENITIPLVNVHSFDKTESVKRARYLLEKFDLKNEIDKYPTQVSGGQRQRAAIARAISHNPQFLLLDEPTSALDPECISDVLDTLKLLQKDGVKMIIVTHEMGFAKSACDKLIFVQDGHILEYGNSKNIFENPNTKELQQFLGKMLEWN